MAVYAYLRVSTKQQLDSGSGLNAQEDACRKWTADHGLEIKMYFRECISGAVRLAKRPVLSKIVDNLSKNDIVIVACRDRIGRGVVVNAEIDDVIHNRGAFLFSAAAEGSNERDPWSTLFHEITDSFGGLERNLIKKRIRCALKSKKERNERVGKIPFCKRLSSDGLHLEDDLTEIHIFDEIKRMWSSGIKLREIAVDLNRRGLLNRTRFWNISSVFFLTKRFDNKK